MKIHNLESEDLGIIKNFIDLYEETNQKYKEYNGLCESVRKNLMYQNYKESNLTIEENCKNILEQITKDINNTKDEYRKKLLKEQKTILTNQLSEIKKYRKIEEVYTSMYYGNISEYFEEKQEEEKDTIIYNIKDEIPEKEYYYNPKSTITQIYVRLKYIYDFYIEFYINKKDMPIDFDFLETNFKFYQVFKEPIQKYMNDKQESIEQIINSLVTEQKEQIRKTK